MTAKATATYTVSFGRPGRPRSGQRTTSPGRTPRVARLLALAHAIDAKIQSGELKDMAHAAKVMGLTRARVTQVMNLLLLAPAIQEQILAMPPVKKGRDPVSERSLRKIVVEAAWERQTELWNLQLTRLEAQAPAHRSSSVLVRGGRSV